MPALVEPALVEQKRGGPDGAVATAENMTDEQAQCFGLLADALRGKHRLPSQARLFGRGLKVSLYTGMATFDDDILTRLVVLAHDRAIRVEIRSGSPGRIVFCAWKRRRDGFWHERHPTMEEAVESVRKAFRGDA